MASALGPVGAEILGDLSGPLFSFLLGLEALLLAISSRATGVDSIERLPADSYHPDPGPSLPHQLVHCLNLASSPKLGKFSVSENF
jgi:hypothetical protein